MDPERTPQPAAPQSPAVGDSTSLREHIHVVAPNSRDSNGVAGRDTTRSQTSSAERHLLGTGSEGYPTISRSHDNPYADFERVPSIPPAARSRDGNRRMPSNRQGFLSTAIHSIAPQTNSGLDWIVPVDEKDHTRRTVGERLQPTIENAIIEREKYARKALWTGYVLNIAIGLQVFLGALTTGLAAAVTNAKQAQVATSVLGGLSTMVASYLARARGSGEPELSITRVKDLEQFLRECRAFQIDHAHEYSTPGDPLDVRVEELRRRFEELLGNANGERRLSPVGITSTQAAS